MLLGPLWEYGVSGKMTEGVSDVHALGLSLPASSNFNQGEITMSSTTRVVVVAALTAIAAVAAFGPEALQAQMYSNNPYRPVP